MPSRSSRQRVRRQRTAPAQASSPRPPPGVGARPVAAIHREDASSRSSSVAARGRPRGLGTVSGAAARVLAWQQATVPMPPPARLAPPARVPPRSHFRPALREHLPGGRIGRLALQAVRRARLVRSVAPPSARRSSVVDDLGRPASLQLLAPARAARHAPPAALHLPAARIESRPGLVEGLGRAHRRVHLRDSGVPRSAGSVLHYRCRPRVRLLDDLAASPRESVLPR
jgi:hypothetical protein